MKDRERLNELRKKIVAQTAAEGRLIVFAGAGVSRAEPDEDLRKREGGKVSGPRKEPPGPGEEEQEWGHLPRYEELAAELYPGEDPGSWLAWRKENPDTNASRFFDTKLEEPDLCEELAQRVSRGDGSSVLHTRVLQLVQRTREPRRILTTNWDLRLEKTAERLGDYGMERWAQGGMSKEEGEVAHGVIHLHGDTVDPPGMVVAHDDMKDHWNEKGRQDFLVEILGEGGPGRKGDPLRGIQPR